MSSCPSSYTDIRVDGNSPDLTLVVEATLAEINAGKVLLAEKTDRKIRVIDFMAVVSGAFATCTSVDLVDTASSSPVVVANIAVAALTNGAKVRPETANVTTGAGFLGTLTANKGIKVQKTGSNATGGTKITFRISYQIV